VLVYGRRSEYAANEIRRSLISAQERDDFKIITFDSLAEDIEHKYEVSIGVRHNEYIDILTDEITNEILYAWVAPTQLRVSKLLHHTLANTNSHHSVTGDRGKWVDALRYASARVRVRSS
jgi:hypothetical protein